MATLFPRHSNVEVRFQYYWALGTVTLRGTIWDDDMLGDDFYIIDFEYQGQDFQFNPWVFVYNSEVRPIQAEIPGAVFQVGEVIEYYINGGIWAVGIIAEMLFADYARVVTAAGILDEPGVRRVRKRL